MIFIEDHQGGTVTKKFTCFDAKIQMPSLIYEDEFSKRKKETISIIFDMVFAVESCTKFTLLLILEVLEEFHFRFDKIKAKSEDFLVPS